MHLAATAEANDLLEREPLALLIGMLLDQQIPLEKAFTSPAVLRDRLGGTFDAAAIAEHDSAALEALFREPPALHRFPAAMAKRVQELARVLVERYDGDAGAVWRDAADGAELLRRIASLPGFGEQKARIFVALLGKQVGVRPPGWREASGAYGENGSFRSVADIVDDASLAKVRSYKKEQKAQAKAR
jgi:uncharacterized HhH-GPD family protein